MAWVALAVLLALGAAIAVSRYAFGRTARGMAIAGKATGLDALLQNDPAQATERLPKTGEQPIHAAAAHDRGEVIDVLVKHGASVNARCEGGGTPLAMAAHFAAHAAIARLVAHGVDVDDCDDLGVTALHTAVSRGHAEIAAALLDAGAQADLKDAAGRTSLDLAHQLEQPEVAALLEARGARRGAQVRMRELKPPKTAGGTHRVPVAMMMRTDHAEMVKARARAREGLPELVKLFEGKSRCAVKGPVNARQPEEKLWLALHELEGETARGVLVSSPIHAPPQDAIEAALSVEQIEDWVAELPDGRLQGGFGLKVMIAYARDEYGTLSEQYAELDRKLAQ